jgi:WD40 repeat protein
VYPGGVSFRSSPSFDSDKIPNKLVRRGSVITGSGIKGNWIKTKDGWLPVKGPNNETLFESVKDSSALSDSKTTEYMRNFEKGLNSFGVDDAASDPYIVNYTGKANSQVFSKFEIQDNAIAAAPSIATKHVSKNLQLKCSKKLTDRNILCMSVSGNQVILGSANHSAYTMSSDLKQTKELHSKKFGHSDWVSCVTHAKKGSLIISGGMDSKICVWSGLACTDLTSHVGSISSLTMVDERLMISTSYDRSIKLWDVEKKALLATMHGHKGAVLNVAINPVDSKIVVSIGRDSLAKIWNLENATCISDLKGHAGHATCGKYLDKSPIACTGAQDGLCMLWDTRNSGKVAEFKNHAKGAAVSDILMIDEFRIASIGADGQVVIFDYRKGTERLASWKDDHENFIYSAALIGDEILTGGGDGCLVRRNLDGNFIEKLKLTQNAIRCIGNLSDGSIVAAGDDGEVFVLN